MKSENFAPTFFEDEFFLPIGQKINDRLAMEIRSFLESFPVRATEVTEFTDRSQALLSVTATNYFFQFPKVDFISNDLKIKLVLSCICPKIVFFCLFSDRVSFFDRSRSQKTIHGASWAVTRNVTLGI